MDIYFPQIYGTLKKLIQNLQYDLNLHLNTICYQSLIKL